MWLGHRRIGEHLSLRVATLSSYLISSPPGDCPWAQIRRGTTLIESVQLPPATDENDVFSLDHRLGLATYLEGDYQVIYTYKTSGLARMSIDSFAIVASGHKDGVVNSLFGFHQAEGRWLLYQDEAGNLNIGKSPKV